jgi:aconitate hydratase
MNPDDYELVRSGDKISILGLAQMVPSVPLNAVIHHNDGTVDEITVNHNLLTEVEIAWFRSGSSLNWIRGNS